MFVKENLMRLALLVGCSFSLANGIGECATDPRCVFVTYENDGSEPTLDNVDGTCGKSCSEEFTCDGMQDCIEAASEINNAEDVDTLLEPCYACIEAMIEYANSTTADSECGAVTVNENESSGGICTRPALASAIQQKTCCGSDDICFSSMAEVLVEHFGKTKVKDLKVGDKVLTGSGDYKTVFTVDHKNPHQRTNFVQIYSTVNGETPLELTEDHMVFLHGKASPVPAKAIKVGDALQTIDSDSPSFVTKISSITRSGVYNAITTDGTIAVDGVVASTYSVHFRSNDEAEIEILGGKIMSHHDFYHFLMTPYRAVCMGVSLSFCDTKEEFNGYSQFGIYILNIFRNQSEFIQDVMIFVALQLAYLFKLLSQALNPFVVTGLVLGTGTYFFCSKKN